LHPRYFVPTGKHTEMSVPSVVAHVFDAFLMKGRGLEREWMAGLDEKGGVTAQLAEPRAELRPAIQAQLAFNEASGRRIRPIEAESLYLFEAHSLAHAPDLPGVNDPVFLQGNLVGPLLAGGAGMAKIAGKLTVPRAEVLHGFVRGAEFAFVHADAVTGRSVRTFHALLPADRHEALRQGHGAVLAYPVMAADSSLYGPGNEAVVDEILYNVLAAVWRDVAREAPPPARKAEDLPVPSRPAHESRLISQGFTITGNRAVRRRGGRLRSFFRAERRRLPPQGHTDLFLKLAQEAVTLLPWLAVSNVGALASGWPAASDVGASRRPPVLLGDPPDPSLSPSLVAREDWIRRFLEAQDDRQRRREQLMSEDDER
jgi:hypothetical protein